MKKLTLMIPAFLILALGIPAQAIGFGSPVVSVNLRGPRIFSAVPLFGTSDYQIGSEWGKKPVKAVDLEKD